MRNQSSRQNIVSVPNICMKQKISRGAHKIEIHDNVADKRKGQVEQGIIDTALRIFNDIKVANMLNSYKQIFKKMSDVKISLVLLLWADSDDAEGNPDKNKFVWFCKAQSIMKERKNKHCYATQRAASIHVKHRTETLQFRSEISSYKSSFKMMKQYESMRDNNFVRITIAKHRNACSLSDASYIWSVANHPGLKKLDPRHQKNKQAARNRL